MKLLLAKAAITSSLIGLASFGISPVWEEAKDAAETAKAMVLERFTTVKVVKEYIQPEEMQTDEMIDRISLSMGINPVITHAIARQESGKNYRSDALRYEAHLEPRFAKLGKSPEERRMLATSIGVMQVIPGYHLKTCNLPSYASLFDVRTNITCGLMVLKACLEFHQKEQVIAKRFRKAFVCYNGDEKYADAIFSNVGEIVLERGFEY